MFKSFRAEPPIRTRFTANSLAVRVSPKFDQESLMPGLLPDSPVAGCQRSAVAAGKVRKLLKPLGLATIVKVGTYSWLGQAPLRPQPIVCNRASGQVVARDFLGGIS
jgi:hypothetical protein